MTLIAVSNSIQLLCKPIMNARQTEVTLMRVDLPQVDLRLTFHLTTTERRRAGKSRKVYLKLPFQWRNQQEVYNARVD